MDLILAQKCCELSTHPDFAEGVTARLIEKTNKPSWSPVPSVSSVLETYFPPLPSPPVIKLPSTPSLSKPYGDYLWKSMSLPSEAEIISYVKGDRPNSGSFALTEKELINLIQRDWKVYGGVEEGIAEKVKQTVWRYCQVGSEEQERTLSCVEGLGDVKWSEADEAKVAAEKKWEVETDNVEER